MRGLGGTKKFMEVRHGFSTLGGCRIPFCSSYVGFGCAVISEVLSIFFLGL